MFRVAYLGKITNPSKFRRPYSSLSLPDIDTEYYCNKSNYNEIKQNIKIRKGVGDISRVFEVYNILKNTLKTDNCYQTIKEELYKQLSNLPNKTHPEVLNHVDPVVINVINNKRNFCDYTPLEFSEITRLLNLMRTDKLGHTCGHKSYYFLGELAELEEALIKYVVTELLKRNFQLVSVPDILHSSILESCGMNINTDRTQVT